MMIFSVLVRSERQYEVVSSYEIQNLYSDSLELCLHHPEVYYLTSRIKEEENLPNRLLVQDYGTIYKEKGKSMVSNYTLNVANSCTCELLLKLGVQKIGLSVEMNLTELQCFPTLSHYPVEVLVYGRVEDMLLKRHPEMTNGFYQMESVNGKYPVIVDKDRTVHIYHRKPIDRMSDIEDLKMLGIRYGRIDFLEESEEEIQEIFKKYHISKKV